MASYILNATSHPQAVHGEHKHPLQSPLDKQTTPLDKPVVVAPVNPPAGSPDMSENGRTGVHWLATYIRLLDSAKSRTLSPVKLRAIKHVHAGSVPVCLSVLPPRRPPFKSPSPALRIMWRGWRLRHFVWPPLLIREDSHTLRRGWICSRVDI